MFTRITAVFRRGSEHEHPRRELAQALDERPTVGVEAVKAFTVPHVRHGIASEIFRIPHDGGALHDGGVPEGWTPHRLYDAVAPKVALVSVGTNNKHGHPNFDNWAQPLVKREGCRLLCTQVTGHCHKALEKPASEAGPEESARLKAVERCANSGSPTSETASRTSPKYRGDTSGTMRPLAGFPVAWRFLAVGPSR